MSNTSNKKRWRRVKCAAVLLCGLGGASAGGLHAETVAWYHFDEGEIGAAPAETGFANAAAPADSPTFLAATVTRGTPTYGKGFADNVPWFDPVARTWAANAKALDFKNARIKIPNQARLQTKSATIELFFKYTGESHGFFRVMEKSKAWLIFFSDKNTLNARVFSSDDGSTTDSTNNQFTATVPGLSVDQWHHLALVIDDTAKTASLYIDYACVGSTRYEGELTSPRVTADIYLGNADGNEAEKSIVNGLIDELRISDAVLTPDQFLRPSIGKTAANVHPETVVYLPFETGDVTDIACFGLSDMEKWRKSTSLLNQVWTNGVASPVNSVSIEYGSDDASCASLSDAVRTSTIRRDVLSEIEVPNAQVLKTELRNSAAATYPDRSPWIKIDDVQTDAEGNRSHGMLTDSFTIEFFANFEMPTGPADSQVLFCGTKTSFNASIRVKNQNAVQLNVGCDGKNVGNYPIVTVGDWHHFAFRYDKARQQVSLFLDYRLCCSPVEVAFDSALASETHPFFELLNQKADGNNGAHGLVDDVRITKRALEPQEFLTGLGVSSETAAAWIDFEDDLLVKPYPDVTPEGTASAMADGAAPARATRKPCRRIVLPDGTKRDNLRALALAGGQVAYGRNLMIENLANQTVEFFLCGDTAPEGAGILRLADGAGATVYAVTAGANGSLSVTVGETSHTFNAVSLADAKWRHYALTFAATSEGATTVTLWVDGEQVGESFTAGALTRTFADSALTVGGGAAAFVGGIDEIRITPQVLEPTDFLRAARPGALLIIR